MSLGKIEQGEVFVDTGEAWKEEKIRSYSGSSTRRSDYMNWLTFDSWIRNIRRDNSDINELYDTLLTDGSMLMKLPPYICESWTWEYLLRDIGNVIIMASFWKPEHKERIEEIAKNIEGKMKIMQAREEYEECLKNAQKKHQASQVLWADWSDEEIEKYKKETFLGDYNILMWLHIKLKNTLEWKEVTNEWLHEAYMLMYSLYDKIIKMPIYALDDTFEWWTIGFELEALWEYYVGNGKDLISSLSEIMNLRHDYKHC